MHDVTDRELQVLALVAEGHENRDISQRLAISDNTVRAHIRALMQKLHARNRTGLAHRAFKARVLKAEEHFPVGRVNVELEPCE